MKVTAVRMSVIRLLLIPVSIGLACLNGRAQAAAQKAMPATARVILLHHSTGQCVWNGGVAAWFGAYNAANKTRYAVTERNFPKDSPYGWENYPYDYWNIWVKNAGPRPFKEEPTLEMLAGQYDVVVLKHCFPVSNIEPDTGRPDVASSDKRIENYKLQYAALQKKMRAFPRMRFLVWTGAALVRNETSEAAARRAKAFFDWVRTEWDQKGDNIFVWDFYQLETAGELYLKAAHASGDSHPNEAFSRTVAPLLCQRIVDVIQGRGDLASITGQGGKPLVVTVPPRQKEPTETATKPAAVEPKTQPAVKISTSGPGRWLFDDAETKTAEKQRWDKGAAYARDGSDNVVKIDFSAGEEEDWGEYGVQRIVFTRPPEKNHDLKPYRYLALRMKTDREIQVMLTLLTLPAPRGPRHQSHFGFSAYLRPKAGGWQWVVLDLTKLELGAEGESAYAKAGKPTRPMHLTAFKLCANKKYEGAKLLLDDITFFGELPEALKGRVQQP